MFEPTSKDFWRAIVLYGSNMSTYKMGLGHLLIDYANQNLQKVPLRDLSEDFLTLYQDRTKNGKPQSRRKIVNGVEKGLTYVEQESIKIEQDDKNREKSVDAVLKNSLEKMVLKKFHTLFKRQIPEPFYTVTDSHLLLQDNLLNLFSEKKNLSMDQEVNSRWDLLEFGFENIEGDESIEVSEDLEIVRKKNERSQISRLRPILNGYQQGKCFYCGIELDGPIEVDHVIPHDAVRHDEIWNLVLAHSECNRQKLNHLPPKPFVTNLIKRNEFVLQSDLPLKEQLKKVVGNTPEKRHDVVWNHYAIAKNKGLSVWGGHDKFNPAEDDFYKQWINYLNETFWSRNFGKVSQGNKGQNP